MAISNPPSTTASLTYSVQPTDGTRPYTKINADAETGVRLTNLTRENKSVVIENLRGNEDSVTLDTAGFQYYKHASKYTSFTDDAEVEKEYYPESIELIKSLTGASRVVLFDHSESRYSCTNTFRIFMNNHPGLAIRRRRPGQFDDNAQKRQPVAQVHVDQTHASAVARVHRHLPPSDAPSLLEHRFQIINLWRPISHSALDWPLGLCDFRSVDTKDDVFPIALVYPDREGEILGVKYNPNHNWKYLHGMKPDEIVLIKW